MERLPALFRTILGLSWACGVLRKFGNVCISRTVRPAVFANGKQQGVTD